MRITTDNSKGINPIFICALAMIAGLFLSRAMLSITTILFLLVCFIRNRTVLIDHLVTIPKLPASLCLLFAIPFVSGLWSTNLQEWWKIVQVKLPLLLFPLAFVLPFHFEKKHWRQLSMFFLFCVFTGTCYSVFQYLANMSALHEAYLKANVIPTPLSGDHIRFSLTVSIAVLLCFFLNEKTKVRRQKIILISLITWFTAYLHLLSARTGLLCLYTIFIGYIFRLFFTSKNHKMAFAGIAALIVIPLVSWWLFPTLQNRIRYLRYDFDFAKNASYLPGATDGNRVLSLKSGWHILKQNPFGVGAGDVRTATDAWYAQHVPSIQSTDKLYPSSEWLVHGAFGGWIGVVLFTVFILYPFFIKSIKARFCWCLLNTLFILSILFDTGLSTQYGVFIHVFAILCWWKWSAEELQNIRD